MPPRNAPRKTPPAPIATVRSPYTEMRPLFQCRADEEGYRSLSDYFFWMAFYDVVLRRQHHMSAALAHLPQEAQEVAVKEAIATFDLPHGPGKPGSLFDARVQIAAQEEHWRLHAEIRSLRDRVRELETALAAEKAQGKLV